MEQEEDYKKTLTDIRNLMDTSARFRSISGLAGIVSGVTALTGLAVFFVTFGYSPLDPFLFVNYETVPFLVKDGLMVLLVSLLFSYLLTLQNARKRGEKIWTPVTKRVLIYWSLPMIAGGILLLPYFSGSGPILFPSAVALTLVFYGLALINASRFSLNELFWMGMIQMILGLIAFFLWKYSLLFWGAGFGVVNVVFGAIVYKKYEVAED
jgi:hypothetical protein